jgi:hypothetical protein
MPFYRNWFRDYNIIKGNSWLKYLQLSKKNSLNNNRELFINLNKIW